MCNITETTTLKRVGYKVVALKNGKYYSTFTGQELSVGEVPEPPLYCKRLCGYWNTDLDDQPLSTLGFANPKFRGYSAAYITKSDAIDLIDRMRHYFVASGFKLVIVKIKFKGKVRLNEYRSDELIAGKEIAYINHIY